MSGTAEHLLDALREFAASAPTAAGLDVAPENAAGELIALGKAVAVLDGVLAGAMARYDHLNAGSPAALLVQHAGLTRTEAANLRRLGRKLETDLPATREKLATGKIGTASARAIADLDEQLASADGPIPQQARRQVEEAMADYAAGATTTEVTRAARDARYRLTPEPVEREMKDQRESRGITLGQTLTGLTHIAGTADPVTAATIIGYLNNNAGRLGPEDTRTAAARRLDALADAITLAQRITTPGATSGAGPAPAGDALPLQESCSRPGAPAQPPSREPGDAPDLPGRGVLQEPGGPPTAPGGCPPWEPGELAAAPDGDGLRKSCSPPPGRGGCPPRGPGDVAAVPAERAPDDHALQESCSPSTPPNTPANTPAETPADTPDAETPAWTGAGTGADRLPSAAGVTGGVPEGGRLLRDSCNGTRRVARPVRVRPGPAVTGEDPRTHGDAPGDPPGGEAASASGRGRLAWRKTSPAHLLIIASHDLLTGAPGAAPARLGDGTMIPAETARRHACEAALTRVILDAPTVPVELGHTTRLFTTSQVRALITRDQGCRWTGCDAPAVACTPHHVTWWADGGATDVTNGALLCPTHHRMVHEDRWQLRWDHDHPDTLVIEAPKHWRHRPPPMTSSPPHTHQPHRPKAAA